MWTPQFKPMWFQGQLYINKRRISPFQEKDKGSLIEFGRRKVEAASTQSGLPRQNLWPNGISKKMEWKGLIQMTLFFLQFTHSAHSISVFTFSRSYLVAQNNNVLGGKLLMNRPNFHIRVTSSPTSNNIWVNACYRNAHCRTDRKWEQMLKGGWMWWW